MIIKKPLIPDNFVRLDSTVLTGSPDNRYVTTRDLQIFQLNHNKLLARRLKHSLITTRACGQNSATASSQAEINSAHSASLVSGDVVFYAPLFISDATNEVRVNLYAAKAFAGANVNLYPSVHELGAPPVLDKNFVITVSTTPNPGTLHTLDIPVNRRQTGVRRTSLSFGITKMAITVMIDGSMDTANLDAAIAITDAGRDYFNAALAADRTDDVAFFSNTLIEPRVIGLTYTVGGGVFRCYVDRPFNIIPIPGTNTVSTRAALSLFVRDVTVYEKAATTFFPAHSGNSI